MTAGREKGEPGDSFPGRGESGFHLKDPGPMRNNGRKTERDKRVGDAPPAYRRERSLRHLLLVDTAYDGSEMAAFLLDPDVAVANARQGMLKNGRTSTVVKCTLAGGDFAVKRSNLKGFWHGLRRAFMTSRAARSWRNARRLLDLGIPTPRPVAVLERRIGPLRRQAYFVSEFVEGPSARDYFTEGNVEREMPAAVAVARIFENLGKAQIGHGDMKGTNIIIHEGKPTLVDLDAMRRYRCRRRSLRAHEKDVARFLKDWKGKPKVLAVFRRLLERGPVPNPPSSF